MSKLLNKTKGSTIVNSLEEAVTFSERSKGLLGRQSIAQDYALWIHQCGSIHTFFMKFPIDAIFVDRNLKVLSVYENLGPWKLTWPHFFASPSVFEMAPGTIAKSKTSLGDQLYVGS